MQIEVKIDKSCPEPKVIIVSDSMSDEVSAILKKLSEGPPVSDNHRISAR